MSPPDRVQLTATGRFGGRPVDVSLRSEGGECTFGSRADPETIATPEHLREALLIGLTRMGILHNLARLANSSAPDHSEGGVREWVSVGSFTPRADVSDPLSFDLAVAGRPSGSASLEVDRTGLPVVRRQTVEFPSGTMRVVERYSAVTVRP